jgi:hypothetical protein
LARSWEKKIDFRVFLGVVMVSLTAIGTRLPFRSWPKASRRFGIGPMFWPVNTHVALLFNRLRISAGSRVLARLAFEAPCRLTAAPATTGEALEVPSKVLVYQKFSGPPPPERSPQKSPQPSVTTLLPQPLTSTREPQLVKQVGEPVTESLAPTRTAPESRTAREKMPL